MRRMRYHLAAIIPYYAVWILLLTCYAMGLLKGLNILASIWGLVGIFVFGRKAEFSRQIGIREVAITLLGIIGLVVVIVILTMLPHVKELDNNPHYAVMIISPLFIWAIFGTLRRRARVLQYVKRLQKLPNESLKVSA
jgi:hypothetical protein